MNTYPSVLWPPHKHDLVFDLDGLLYVVQAMAGTLENEPARDPTEEELEAWMRGGDE